MFYSHELLGRKSPLGAVWIAAHGKKLNRSKVMNVNVVQTCEQLINPEVPQALRLQGILIGGIVIVFNRQQTYLLEDCNDTLRKVRAVTIDQAGSTVLQQGKQQARPDAITVPDIDQLFGCCLNLALENPFGAVDHMDEALLEDDMFVMPTIPDTVEAGSTQGLAGERRQRSTRANRQPLPLAAPTNNTVMELPTGLELQDTMLMDQEETFMMPELGMDMFDMGMPPFPEPADPGANQDMQAQAEPLVNMPEADPAPMPEPNELHDPLPAPGPREGMAEEEAHGQEAQAPVQEAGAGSLEAMAQEQAAAERAAKEARAKKRGRKRPAQLVIDDADAVQIRGTVFRAWTQDTDELVQERPQKLLRLLLTQHFPGCRPQHVSAGGDLRLAAPLSASFGQGGKWGSELEDLFAHSIMPGGAQGNQAAAPLGNNPEEMQLPLENGPEEMALPLDNGPEEMPLPLDEGMLYPDMGIDLPDHTAHDISMLEGEVEVERLRAALATPGSMTDEDHARAVQLGLTPGSSNPLEHRGKKRQKRASSAFRVDSDTRPAEDRSSPHSQKRLSDLMMGTDVGEAGIGLEGHLEDMLPPEAAEVEGMTHAGGFASRPGGLTQFHLLEDSAPATQTQRAVTDAITKSTLSMIGLLRDKFTDLEEQSEEPALSLLHMTASLTRSQAAKLFYQICVTHSNNFVQATQEEPFGDIIISRGPFL